MSDFGQVVHKEGAGRGGACLIVCEHASNRIPASFQGLGLSAEAQMDHIAWDPGALDLAQMIAAKLDSPLVYCGVSRLIFDCNRTPAQPDAIPAHSEIYDIPGNAGLSQDEISARVSGVYEPFHMAVAEAVTAGATPRKALVTVHTFTPVYRGQARAVEIGLLHGQDPAMALAMLEASKGSGFDTQLNAPYGPYDSVSHMVDRHGHDNGLPNVMIEVRNDLATDPARQDAIAGALSDWIVQSLASVEALS